MPAVLAGIAGAVAAWLADEDDYKDRFDIIIIIICRDVSVLIIARSKKYKKKQSYKFLEECGQLITNKFS